MHNMYTINIVFSSDLATDYIYLQKIFFYYQNVIRVSANRTQIMGPQLSSWLHTSSNLTMWTVSRPQRWFKMFISWNLKLESNIDKLELSKYN